MSGVSVVIPVKDGERYLEELLDALAREGVDEILVIDSGSQDRSVEIAARPAAELLRDRAGRVRPRAHPQPRRRTDARRADLLPDPGRDALPRLARRLPRGVHARRARRRRLRPAPAAPRHEPDDRPRADRVLRGLLPRRRARRAARRRPDVPLERQRLLRARLLGGDPLPRRRLLRGPGLRRGHARRRLDQGLPPGRRRPARPRLRPVEFMRRYFDEYRGLREATGHVEPFALARSAGHVRRAVARRPALDGRAGHHGPEAARWTARSTVHHAGRKVFSALGSRAEACPRRVRRGSRSRAAPTAARRAPAAASNGTPAHGAPALPPTTHVRAQALARGLRGGRAGLGQRPGAAARPGAGWPSASGCASRW